MAKFRLAELKQVDKERYVLQGVYSGFFEVTEIASAARTGFPISLLFLTLGRLSVDGLSGLRVVRIATVSLVVTVLRSVLRSDILSDTEGATDSLPVRTLGFLGSCDVGGPRSRVDGFAVVDVLRSVPDGFRGNEDIAESGLHMKNSKN